GQIGAANVVVSSANQSGIYIISFTGALAGVSVPQLDFTSNLTSGSMTVLGGVHHYSVGNNLGTFFIDGRDMSAYLKTSLFSLDTKSINSSMLAVNAVDSTKLLLVSTGLYQWN